MKILEKDLYKFVFFTEELSEEKRAYIQSNLDNFKVDLDFLHNMNAHSTEEISPIILNKFYDKIGEQENENEVILERVNNEEEADYIFLAAASENIETDSKTETFQDSKNTFLAKVITEKEQNKLFIFSRNNNHFSKVILTLYPSEENHTVDFNEEPFIIKPKQIIDKIIFRSY